jgi:hypothetical protein
VALGYSRLLPGASRLRRRRTAHAPPGVPPPGAGPAHFFAPMSRSRLVRTPGRVRDDGMYHRRARRRSSASPTRRACGGSLADGSPGAGRLAQEGGGDYEQNPFNQDKGKSNAKCFNGFTDVSSKPDAIALFFARLLSGSLQGTAITHGHGQYAYLMSIGLAGARTK